MSVDPADNALIERYLLGKLTDAEIADFNARLECDREFARKFRLIKMFPEMMTEAGRKELEKKIIEAAERLMAEKPPRYPNKKLLLWGAVSVSILVIVLLLIIFSGKHRTPQTATIEQNKIMVHETVSNAVVPAPGKDTAVPATQKIVNPQVKEVQKRPAPSILQKAIGPVSPEGNAKFYRKDTIFFRWNQKCDTFTRLYIYSDANNMLMLWRGITPGIQKYRIPGTYLFPGTYYWYVGSAKDDKHSFMVVESK